MKIISFGDEAVYFGGVAKDKTSYDVSEGTFSI
jgi:hypothetical protein